MINHVMCLNSSSENALSFFMPFSFQIKLKEIFETPAEISLVLELVTGGRIVWQVSSPGGKVLHANNGWLSCELHAVHWHFSPEL